MIPGICRVSSGERRCVQGHNSHSSDTLFSFHCRGQDIAAFTLSKIMLGAISPFKLAKPCTLRRLLYLIKPVLDRCRRLSLFSSLFNPLFLSCFSEFDHSQSCKRFLIELDATLREDWREWCQIYSVSS
jgi:hypothetical protein